MAGIGEQRMGGVSVPSLDTRASGAPSGGASLLTGVGQLLQTGAGLLSRAQQQEAQQAETAALADVELSLLDVEEQAGQGADLFRAVAGVQQQADTNGDGQISEEEAAALEGFDQFKNKIKDNVFDPNRAGTMLRNKKRELIAQYPSLAEHIVDRAAKAEELVSNETRLFSSPSQMQEFQKIYGTGPINGLDYQKFTANQSYLASMKSQGAVTLNNIKTSAAAEVNVGLINMQEQINTMFRDNPQAMRNPAQLMSMLDTMEGEMLTQVSGFRGRAAESQVPIPADELNTFIKQQSDRVTSVFDKVRDAKDPVKVLGDITKMNELMVQSAMQDVAPQAMALAGQDGTGKTLQSLVNISLNGGPQSSIKLKAALDQLPGEYSKQEMMALIDFHAALQDPDRRKQYIISNPYRAAAVSTMDGANGGGDQATQNQVDAYDTLLRQNQDKQLTDLYESLASSPNGIRNLADSSSETKIKFQGHIEARVKQMAQNLEAGQGDAPGAEIRIGDDGQPTVIVSAISGGGRERQIQKFPDQRATKALRNAMKIYSDGGLGSPEELLSIFTPPEQEGADLPVVEQKAQPTTPRATPASNAVEALEDVAFTTTTATGERATRIRERQIRRAIEGTDLSPEQANDIVQRLQGGEDAEVIIQSLSSNT